MFLLFNDLRAWRALFEAALAPLIFDLSGVAAVRLCFERLLAVGAVEGARPAAARAVDISRLTG